MSKSISEPPALAQRFALANAQLPLIAILRGIPPSQAVGIGQALYASGFRLIEVPLNSPDPFTSIAALRNALPGDALVGAGTVLRVDQVAELKACGGDLTVMPHADASVIRAAKHAGMLCVPGVATPTEAFAALAAGADALKLFPAEMVTPPVLKAMRAVLPQNLRLFPVGGITPESMKPYLVAGANGFGLGSALYSPGLTAEEVRGRATLFVTAWQTASYDVNGPTPYVDGD